MFSTCAFSWSMCCSITVDTSWITSCSWGKRHRATGGAREKTAPRMASPFDTTRAADRSVSRSAKLPATLFFRCCHSWFSLARPESFLTLHRLSGAVSYSKFDQETNSCLSNHLWNLASSSRPTDCACTCACAPACLPAYLPACMCVKFVFDLFGSLLYNGLCAPIWKKTAQSTLSLSVFATYYYPF